MVTTRQNLTEGTISAQSIINLSSKTYEPPAQRSVMAMAQTIQMEVSPFEDA
jgi:hypothetical protein